MSADKYQVAAGTQIHHDGTTYTEGQSVPLDEQTDAELVAYWLNAGWLESTPTRASRKR